MKIYYFDKFCEIFFLNNEEIFAYIRSYAFSKIITIAESYKQKRILFYTNY